MERREETLEDVQRMRKWNSEQRQKFFNIVLQQNAIIEELERRLESARSTLEYCSIDGLGTAYQQREARMELMQMDKDVEVHPSNKKELEEVRKQMKEHSASWDGTVGRYNALIGRTINKVPAKSRVINPFVR